MNIDVILGTDGQVVGVHVDGHGTFFQAEKPYVHSMPMDSGWRVRRYTRRFPSANGYVVLPRPEFDALTAALHKWSCGSEGHSLDCQRAAAVVEAVGPTP